MLHKTIYYIASALLTWSIIAVADDTEIYLNPSAPNAAPPLVMMTFDYRPNLGSSACSNYLSVSCQTSTGNIIYPYLVKNIEEFSQAYRDLDDSCVKADGSITIPCVLDPAVDNVTVEPFDLVRATIRTLLSDPSLYGVNVGLMLSHDDTCTGVGAGPTKIPSGGLSGCSNGAYVLKGFTPLEKTDFVAGDVDSASDRYALLAKLGRIASPQGTVAHDYQLREIYYELYQYLTGGALYNTYLGYADFASTENKFNLDECAYYDHDANIITPNVPKPGSCNDYRTSPSGGSILDTSGFAQDTTIIDTSGTKKNHKFISPYSNGQDWSCSKTFAINTFFEDTKQSDSDGAFASSAPGLTLSGGDTQKNKSLFDYLNRTDIIPGVDGAQTVQSYFITAKTSTNEADDYAFNGGTGRAFTLKDPTLLLEDLRNVFREIKSVSTTFVAASVPVNVFNRTEVVDNLYFALFQAEKTPRWNGNMKKLKLVERTGSAGDTYFEIVSSENTSIGAIANDGRIRSNALTYWTNKDGYDVQTINANPDDVTEEIGFDGRSVNRGGMGQQIPGFLNPGNPSAADEPGLKNLASGTRRLYTETINNFDAIFTPTVTSTAFALDTTSAATLQNRLGVHSTIEAEKLIKWIRGYHVDHSDYATDPTLIRPWLMGDPIHSRPVVINYGELGGYSKDNPNIRIFLGSNDGFLRAIKDSSSGSNATGRELFGFMPQETMLNNQSLRLNVASTEHIYGIDGAPVVLTIDKNGDGNIDKSSGDKAIVYFGLRRGGRAYYALDVSDSSDNIVPSVLWKLKKPVSVSGTNGTILAGANRIDISADLTLTPGQLAGGRLNISSGTHSTPNATDSFYHIIGNDEKYIYVRDDDDGTGNATTEFVDADTNISWNAEVFGNSDFSELGLTFSTPRIGTVRFGATPTPVLIFGAGYDPDKDNLGMADDDEGAGIYIVNALTGDLIWKATGSGVSSATHYINSDMVDSIPAPVTILDNNGDGIIDRMYVGDTGGSVWRVDLSSGTTDIRATWKVSKLADLGADDGVNDRRFFHAADVVRTKDAQGRYDGVIIASGNRASPKRTSVENHLFVIKDRNVNSGAGVTTLLDINMLTDITDACITGADTEASCVAAKSSSTWKNGWHLKLEETGEKSLAAPLVAAGTIFLTSYLPLGNSSEGTCAPNEGSGLIYAVKLENGSVDTDIMPGAVIDKSSRSITAGAGIPPGATPLGSDNILLPGKGINDRQIIKISSKTRWKTFWREIGIDTK